MREGIVRGVIGGLLGCALYNVFIMLMKATLFPDIKMYLQILVSTAGSLFIILISFKRDDFKLFNKRLDDIDKSKADRTYVDSKINNIKESIIDHKENEKAKYDQLFEISTSMQHQIDTIYRKLITD
jgi:hypothetical protein